jgi:hypothetical protein
MPWPDEIGRSSTAAASRERKIAKMVGPIDIAGMLSHTDYAMFMGSPGNICPMSWKRCLQHRLPLSLTSKQRWFKYNVNKNNK